jgi:hypothetical protein
MSLWQNQKPAILRQFTPRERLRNLQRPPEKQRRYAPTV